MKMKNTFGAAVVAVSSTLLVGLSATAHADTPSFNFVQVDYIISGDADAGMFYGPGPLSKFEVSEGLGLKGAFEVGDLFFVSGETQDITYENSPFVQDFVVTDSTFVGGGAHFPVADMAELYAQVGLARATIANYAANGYGLKLGARVNVGIAEFGAWYQKSEAEFKPGSMTLDYDPEVMGLDVALTFAENAPQLVLGYTEATYELSASNLPSIDIDTDNFSIGVRKTF